MKPLLQRLAIIFTCCAGLPAAGEEGSDQTRAGNEQRLLANVRQLIFEGRKDPLRATATPGFDGLPVFTPDGNGLAWTSKRSADGRALQTGLDEGEPGAGFDLPELLQ